MKAKVTYSLIGDLFDRNMQHATQSLKRLPSYCGGEIKLPGLSGWVFEQVVQHCLRRELRSKGIECRIAEQVPISGRARADVGLDDRILIEIKHSGAYDSSAFEKYHRYQGIVESRGMAYLWISGEEWHAPYRNLATKAFGSENTF